MSTLKLESATGSPFRSEILEGRLPLKQLVTLGFLAIPRQYETLIAVHRVRITVKSETSLYLGKLATCQREGLPENTGLQKAW